MTDLNSLAIYIFVYGVSAIFFSLYDQRNKGIAFLGISMATVIPAVFAGLRSNVGTDYPVYYYIFDHIQEKSFEWIMTDEIHFNQEKGFLILSKAIVTRAGPKWTFGVFAFLIVLVATITLIRQYKNYNVALIFFVFLLSQFTDSFNTLRQSIAVVILFWGLKYVFEGSAIKYGGAIVVAMLFHTSAILALPVYFLWNHRSNETIKLSKTSKYYIAAILFVLVWRPALSFLSNEFNLFYSSKYSVYLIGNGSSNRSFFIKAFLVIVFVILDKYYREYDKRMGLFINMYIIGTILEFTGFYTPFIKRISEYYCAYTGTLLLCAVPLLIAGTRNKKIASVGVLLYEIVLFFITSCILHQGGYIPYQV